MNEEPAKKVVPKFDAAKIAALAKGVEEKIKMKQVELDLKKWEKEMQRSNNRSEEGGDKGTQMEEEPEKDSGKIEFVTSVPVIEIQRLNPISFNSQQNKNQQKKNHLCGICRRKFPSNEHLENHIRFSELHKDNIYNTWKDIINQ
eukprot:TRINITY_DN846_c0_g1_i4.p2 TRINITY_DN846_c0_g1~~TRINITY_DN846_c0_g1_i4.p2  ORF type:complete len:145 (+),score=52.12 TRINITY_DN846_c0_g1_i4:1704-2138(+)